jgi:hypothetical protein
MVSSRTILLFAAAITQTIALPFDGFLQFGRRANYSVINVDGSNGPNPTALAYTVTTTVTVTAAPERAAVKTVYVTAPAVTLTAALPESTSWYDDGMWHTSYFTRIPANEPATDLPSPTPSSTAALETFSIPSSAPVGSSTLPLSASAPASTSSAKP